MTLRFVQRLSRGSFVLDAAAELPAQGVTVLFGASGSGKTTLLRCIAGLEQSVEGEVRVGEHSWQGACGRVPPQRRPVGVVFQEAALFPHLTVAENLKYGWRRVARTRRRLSTAEIAEATGISAILSRSVTELSGGERQRVAIARALLCCPELLLMDEPMASLDSTTKKRLLTLLSELGTSFRFPVLYVTHSVQELAVLGDRVLTMVAGRIVANEPVNEMLSRLDSASLEADRLNMVEANYAGFEPEDHLSRFEFGATVLLVPSQTPQRSGLHRLAFRASDVSLCRSEPEQSSILNVFPVLIEQSRPLDLSTMLVRLCAHDQAFLATVSRRSYRELSLQPGLRCFAQIKSTALL